MFEYLKKNHLWNFISEIERNLTNYLTILPFFYKQIRLELKIIFREVNSEKIGCPPNLTRFTASFKVLSSGNLISTICTVSPTAQFVQFHQYFLPYIMK